MREFPTVYVVIQHVFGWDSDVMFSSASAVAGFYHLEEAEEYIKNRVTDKSFNDYTIDKIQVK